MKGQVVNFGTEKNPCIVFDNINPSLEGREKEALYVIQIGSSKHIPLKTELLCRNSYSLHYIKSGENIVNGVRLSAGQGYFMAPNENNIIKYPDKNTAEIYWIMFVGYKAQSFLKECGINMTSHVYKLKENDKIINLIKCAMDYDYSAEDLEMSFISLLYKIGAIHKKENASVNINEKTNPVDIAVSFIQQNYSRILNVKEISDFVGLSQNHLCKLFIKEFNCSIKEYLTIYRVKAAKSLLKNSNINISQTAFAVGYNDSMYFSQVFKKYTGMTPRKYRRYNEL